MGDLAELPEDASWNATTGTFDKAGTKAAEINPEQFAEMIEARFNASELTPDQKTMAMTMLDNAAVYLHQADPTNRLDRTPTANSIAAEWATLGIQQREAAFMLDRSIEHTAQFDSRQMDIEDALRRDAEIRNRDAERTEETMKAFGLRSRGEDEMEL